MSLNHLVVSPYAIESFLLGLATLFFTMRPDDFLLLATSDLTRHIHCTEDITRAARLRFRDQSTAIMERLRGGEKIPRPTKWSDQNCKVYCEKCKCY